MVEIRNSVKLDFENKEIVCSLPLRGKEEDFLSSNRNKALKVFNFVLTITFIEISLSWNTMKNP